MGNPISRWIVQRAERLRFPYLFALTAGLFVLDLFIPDALPFADELLLGLLTMMLGSWKKKRRQALEAGHRPPSNDG